MQCDGNLVIYRNGKPLWSSKTAGQPGAVLSVQNDGNVVIYRSGKALWSTGTVQGDGGSGGGTTSVAETAARRAEARLGQVEAPENPHSRYWSGYCQTFARIVYAKPWTYPSALAHYRARRDADQIRSGVPPRGALVFYGGGGGYGHVAISVGGGQVIGTLGYDGDRKPVSRTSYTYFPSYYGWAMP
jgi:cell wall-associated NlpC family hydrolase